MMKLNPVHRGFSIIEVLVAILVLALGILAVVKLQGVLVQSASDSNHRAIAVSLAQQKIDDLRGFAETAAFLLIGTDQGGQILPATGGAFSIARGSYQYRLGWEVQDYFHLTSNDPGESAVTGTPGVGDIPAGATPAFKIVNVFVAWQDETGAWEEQTGQPQQVTLETIIDSYPPGLTSASSEPSPGGVPPQASYTPEGAPDVIDIEVDTGAGTKRQTSKPLPDVVKTGQDENTIVSFEVITYQERDSTTSGDFVAKRQEEFVTVDCNCRLSAEPGPAMTPAHAVWDEVSKSRFDVMGEWVSKPTAVEVDNSNDAEELCVVCCRDHHDADESPVKYVAGTTLGNHKHYKADSIEAGAGDVYTESCRLKRVDGILRVYQDWNLIDITILDRLQLLQTAYQEGYQDFVEDLLLFEVVGEAPAATKPGLSLSTNEGVQLQLESRGVYIDEVYDFEGSVSAEYWVYVEDSTKSDRLEKVPFSEVNLTLLSNWISADPDVVSVTNDEVATIADPANDYYGTYSRGYINAIQQTTALGVDITTTIQPSNDGLTQLATPPFDEAEKAGDTASVVVEAAGDAFTVSGTYEITFPLGKSNPLTVSEILTPEGSGSCIFPGKPGNTYTCSLNAPWSGSLKIKAEVKNSCSGESVAFQDGGANTNVTHDFASFACD